MSRTADHASHAAGGLRPGLGTTLLQPRTSSYVERRGAGDQGFRFSLADSESGTAAIRPVSATKREALGHRGPVGLE
jgi:hypothetical protein